MKVSNKDCVLVRVSKINQAIIYSQIGHHGFTSANDVIDYAVKEAKLKLRKQ